MSVRRQQTRIARCAAFLAVALTLTLSSVPALAIPIQPDPGTPDDSTLRVTVRELSPRDLTPQTSGGEVIVRGTVQNAGNQPVGEVGVRLQRGPIIQTRGELKQVDESAPDPEVSCEWLDLPQGIGPGQAVPFEYRCPVSALAATSIGIYPVSIRARGSMGGGEVETLGEVHTYLPSFPEPVAAQTRVSWLWPLIDRPHSRAIDQVFVDDDLGVSVAEGGRLDRMLGLAEQAAAQRVPMTLVVDPALVDELRQMEGAYRVRSASGLVAGRYGPQATAWLNRLRALAASQPMMLVPYGDSDAVALQRAALGDLATVRPEDQSLVAERLGVEPGSTVAWPPGEAVTDQVLNSLVGQGATGIVLASDTLPGLPAASRTPTAVAPLPVTDGKAVALVADSDVAGIVAGVGDFVDGPRLAEQRYLTELAMITAEEPSNGRDLLVVPPRRWDPDPALALRMLTEARTTPWLAAASAASLPDQPVGPDRGRVEYPERAERDELTPAFLTQMGQVRSDVEDFSSSMVDPGDARDLVESYDQTLRMAGSSAWRSDPRYGERFLVSVRGAIGRTRAGVHIAEPSGSGVYSLASSGSPLPLTVVNDLSDPVKVRLRVTSRASGFTVKDLGEQVIDARSRTTIKVPATVERSGTFMVEAVVTTPAGRALGDGDPVQLKVRSTAFGAIGLIITGAALALLLVLTVRRIIRRARRQATEPQYEELSPHAEEAYLSNPGFEPPPQFRRPWNGPSGQSGQSGPGDRTGRNQRSGV